MIRDLNFMLFLHHKERSDLSYDREEPPDHSHNKLIRAAATDL